MPLYFKNKVYTPGLSKKVRTRYHLDSTLDLYRHEETGLQTAAAANFDSIIQHKESKPDKVLKAIIQI